MNAKLLLCLFAFASAQVFAQTDRAEIQKIVECLDGKQVSCDDETQDLLQNILPSQISDMRVLQSLIYLPDPENTSGSLRYWSFTEQVDIEMRRYADWGLVKVQQERLTQDEQDYAYDAYYTAWREFGEKFLAELAVKKEQETDRYRKHALEQAHARLELAYFSSDMEDMPLAMTITEYPGRDWILQNFMLEFRGKMRGEYLKHLAAYPVFKYLKSASPDYTELREAYLRVLSSR